MHYIRRFSILSYFYGSFQFWDTFRALFLFLASPNTPLTFDFTHSSSWIKTILDHSFRINKWLTQPIVVIVQTTILNIEKKKLRKWRGFFTTNLFQIPRIIQLWDYKLQHALCLSLNGIPRNEDIGGDGWAGGLVCIDCGRTSLSRNFSVREKPVTQTVLGIKLTAELTGRNRWKFSF